MNKLREMANKGENALGTFVELGGANVVEALGQTGLDFIIVDMSMVHLMWNLLWSASVQQRVQDWCLCAVCVKLQDQPS